MVTKIKVPALLANIGPGFDVLGIGLDLYLEITVEQTEEDTSSDEYNCKLIYEGDGTVPLNSGENLITQTALYVMRCNGVGKFPQGTRVSVKNPIPLGRGLGSSGAAIVGGVILGNEIGKFGFDKKRMLDYCLLIERHPDNIAAAMLGGFVGSYLNELTDEETAAKSVPLESILPKATTKVIESRAPPKNIGEYIKYPWNKEVKCITIIPNFEVKTDDARAVLPATYEKADVIFNLQRLATLTTSLGQSPVNPQLIYNSMKDKLHQPYRSKLIPGLTEVLQTISPEIEGVCGICLSGAGPTILCLATSNFEAISKQIQDLFAKNNVLCSVKVLDLAYDGATVTTQ